MNTLHYSVCPVCGHPELKPAEQYTDYTVSRETFQIVICPNCQTGITQDMPAPDSIEKYYKSESYISHSDTKKGVVNKMYHFARQQMLQRKLRLVRHETKKKTGKLADIGCGTGYFPNIMQQNGWQTYNADADADARKFAIENFGLSVSTPIELFKQMSDNKLDVITMWHVLEHVHDLDGYLSEIYRMLQQNGIFIVAVPNYQSYDAQHYGSTWAGWDVPRHLWHFSPKSIQVLAQKYGFEVKKMKMMPFDPFYVSLLSEKYRENTLALFSGFLHGKLSFLRGIQDVKKSSSIIYTLQKH